MSKERAPSLSSQQFGNNLGEILDHKAGALSRIQEEIEDLRDTPAVLAREHQAAYHETFYDTYAKELLWRAEHMVPHIMAEAEESYYLRGLKSDTLMIDVIEAYGSVIPDEGLRLIDEMPESPQKVEALARFGRVTDPVFIAEAREMAVKLDKDDGYYHHGESLFAVAHYGNDDISLGMAYRAVVHSYENPARVRVDGSPGASDWRSVDNLCKLASLGHKPALQRAKAAIINNSARDKNSKTKHWVETAALVEYIDELLQRGNLGQRVDISANSMPQYETTEQAWQNFVLDNKDSIVAVLKEGVELPRFDSLSRNLGIFQYHIENSTSLNSTGKTMDYIDERADEYAEGIEQQELPAARLKRGKLDRADGRYLHPRADLKRRYDESVSMLKHNGWGHLIGKGGLEGDIASTDKEAADIMSFLNNLALLRAMAIAATHLATSTGPDS